jgi:hypothetical protein
MELVKEHIKGSREDVLKCCTIAGEIALGRASSSCVAVPIASEGGEVRGLVIGMDLNNVSEDVRDLALALAVKLGLDAEMANELRPAQEAADEVSYTFV